MTVREEINNLPKHEKDKFYDDLLKKPTIRCIILIKLSIIVSTLCDIVIAELWRQPDILIRFLCVVLLLSICCTAELNRLIVKYYKEARDEQG